MPTTIATTISRKWTVNFFALRQCVVSTCAVVALDVWVGVGRAGLLGDRGGRGSRDERVAGLVDGGGDVGAVHGAVGGDGDGAAGQVDGHRRDAVDGGDLLGDGALAVGAGHAGDGEGGRADEGARRAGQHGNSSGLRVVVRSGGSVDAGAGDSHRGNRRDLRRSGRAGSWWVR